ncbi:MAG: hypothetical protein HY551_07015 [Elusimicrobia bacterium]|nr:hypothetical protein [Elusimicrobiota bacterium]
MNDLARSKNSARAGNFFSEVNLTDCGSCASISPLSIFEAACVAREGLTGSGASVTISQLSILSFARMRSVKKNNLRLSARRDSFPWSAAGRLRGAVFLSGAVIDSVNEF